MSNKKLKKSQIAVSKEMIDVIRNLSIKTDRTSPTIKISKGYHYPDLWVTSDKARIMYYDSVFFGHEEKIPTISAGVDSRWKYFPRIVTGTFPDKFPEQFLPKWGANGERGFWIDSEKFYKILKSHKNPIIDFGDIKENCRVYDDNAEKNLREYEEKLEESEENLIKEKFGDLIVRTPSSQYPYPTTPPTIKKSDKSSFNPKHTKGIFSKIKIFNKGKNPEDNYVQLEISNIDRNGNNPSDETGFSKLRRKIKNSQNLEIKILEKDIPFLTKRNTSNKLLAVESVDGKPRIRGKIKDEIIFDRELKKVKSRNKRFHFSFHQGFLKRLPKGDYTVIFSESGSIWENQTDKKYSVIITSAYWNNPNTGPLEQTTQHWLDKPKTLNQFNEGYSMSDFPKLYPKENKQIQKESKQIAITWQKGVDAIIETGSLLLLAKKKYAKNDLLWNTFLETLPFSKRTMDRLIFIGEKKSILMNKKIYPQLPPNWGTLYELVTIGNEKTPVPRFENDKGEISDTKKKGYTEITLNTKDFIVKALDEDKLRPDATRNEISNYKKSIEAEYFEVKPKRKIDKPLEFVIRASVSTAKKDIQQFNEGLDKLLKANPQFSLRK